METPYSVSAIYSKSRNYIYVGISNDVQRRLREHNLGYNKTTKPYGLIDLINIMHLIIKRKTNSMSFN